MELLIGIDIGTTNIKAVAYDLAGVPAGEASQPTPSRIEGPRQASTDPNMLWAVTSNCLKDLLTRLPGDNQISGLAIASVGEAGVLLDKAGQPLCPIIAWYDERTVDQAQTVSSQLDDSAIYKVTGLPPGHTYTIPKLLWLREQYPGILNRAVTWLSVCDWIAYCLGGGYQIGLSQASRTLALDLAHARWWRSVLDALGIPQHIFPQLLPEGSRIGAVSGPAAQQ
ncbi:MAG: FGGY-family carbohydrate kinase, partial [Anaerolineae bacterium]